MLGGTGRPPAVTPGDKRGRPDHRSRRLATIDSADERLGSIRELTEAELPMQVCVASGNSPTES